MIRYSRPVPVRQHDSEVPVQRRRATAVASEGRLMLADGTTNSRLFVYVTRATSSSCSSAGSTLSRYVLGQRLARAHRRLTDPRHAGSTVAAIAYASGFRDSSTFNRAFRQQFGMTPSDARAGRNIPP